MEFRSVDVGMQGGIECYAVEFACGLDGLLSGGEGGCTGEIGGELVYDFLPVETCWIWLGWVVVCYGP